MTRRFEIGLIAARPNSGRSSIVSEEPKFKIGLRVWSPVYGWGEVQLSKDETFPVLVMFYNAGFGSPGLVYYTAEGKIFECSPLPSLFLNEISASDWPDPPAKVDPSALVVGQDLEAKLSSHDVWILTKFAMLKDGVVWVFSHNNDSKSAEIMYKTEDFRLPVPQKGV